MRLLICGGRTLNAHHVAGWLLDNVERVTGGTPDVVIHGGAAGGDTGAAIYALAAGVPQLMFKALWGLYGKAAGWRRNQRMLDEGKPDCVLALPGGRGTADMVRRAESAGVRVVKIEGDEYAPAPQMELL